MNEELMKSIDAEIDALFSEEEVKTEESVEKSIDIKKDADKTADAAVAKAPKAQKDEARGAGRPKQISDVPQTDTDGARAKDYDKDIKERDDKEDEPEETDQVKEPAKMKKSVEISEEEYEQFQALKKSQEEKTEEELKKAETQKQEDLIKSVLEKAEAKHKTEMDELRKSLKEQGDLIKAMAKKPVQSKAITNIDVIEKGGSKGSKVSTSTEEEFFSKSEMLDAAEELAKAGKIPTEAVIELENTGNVYNPHYKKLIERKLNS